MIPYKLERFSDEGAWHVMAFVCGGWVWMSTGKKTRLAAEKVLISTLGKLLYRAADERYAKGHRLDAANLRAAAYLVRVKELKVFERLYQ